MIKKPLPRVTAHDAERVVPFHVRPLKPSVYLVVGHHFRIFNRVARVIHYSSDFVLYEAREFDRGYWHYLGIFRRPNSAFLDDYDQVGGREVEAYIKAVIETNKELRHG